MVLTYKQALFAAYTILDDLHDQTRDESLRELLSDMNPFIFTDHTPVDRATWGEWVNCATAIQNDGNLTDNEIFETLISFLRYNEGEYGYHLDSILKDLQTPFYRRRWEQLLNKVSKNTDVK
jgi:hypothetical protein